MANRGRKKIFDASIKNRSFKLTDETMKRLADIGSGNAARGIRRSSFATAALLEAVVNYPDMTIYEFFTKVSKNTELL